MSLLVSFSCCYHGHKEMRKDGEHRQTLALPHDKSVGGGLVEEHGVCVVCGVWCVCVGGVEGAGSAPSSSIPGLIPLS